MLESLENHSDVVRWMLVLKLLNVVWRRMDFIF